LQYACIAAGWSAQTQALEVDVKFVDSINEVMRLAAPCVTAYTCAAGFNISSIFVFTEISMLDSMVSQATAGAIRALPYGLFASLVPHDIFFKTIASNVDDSKQYHTLAQQVFTDIQLPPLYWPSALSNQAEHATWIAYAAIDAWLSIVPFPYLSQARAVVNLHSSSSFVPSVSNAIGRNGRICTLAALYLDQSLHCIKTEDYSQFVAAAWLFVDYAAICLFSARTFGFEHPSRSRIEANFKKTLWKVMQIDRSPLPQMSGCDKYAKATVKCMCIINNDWSRYVAKDGQRLSDLYGEIPGWWIHSSLVVADFEKNITKWSGKQAGFCDCGARGCLTRRASGQPTNHTVKVRGVKATKNLKKGAIATTVLTRAGRIQHCLRLKALH